jgi:gamma-glutamyl:cysteine ligase YbdK (ATP-grasp superfamily)
VWAIKWFEMGMDTSMSSNQTDNAEQVREQLERASRELAASRLQLAAKLEEVSRQLSDSHAN